MDGPNPIDESTPEMPKQREERLLWQRAEVAQAETEIAAGLGVDWAIVKAWLDVLDHEPEAPFPHPAPVSRP